LRLGLYSVSSSDKEKRRKTDKVDALKLARNYASGELKGVHVPAEELQRDRNLVRFRKKLVGDLTRSRNRIKSLLKYQGIDIPGQFDKAHWSRNFKYVQRFPYGAIKRMISNLPFRNGHRVRTIFCNDQISLHGNKING